MREKQLIQVVDFYDNTIKNKSINHNLEKMVYWSDESRDWANAKLHDMIRGLNCHYLEMMLSDIDWSLIYPNSKRPRDYVTDIAMTCSMNLRLLSTLISKYHKKLKAANTSKIGDKYLIRTNRDQVWGTQLASYEGSVSRLQPLRGVEKSDEVWKSLSEEEILLIDKKRSERRLPPLMDYLEMNSLDPTMWNRVMTVPEMWSVGRSILQLERLKQSLIGRD